MMVGAAAGVAVGAVGGALLMNALGMSTHFLPRFCPALEILMILFTADDDDENHGGSAPQYPPMQGDLPDKTADGSSVSSSDKEDVEEAREAHEEAYEETYGSD